jgi:hypothetical protein
MHVVIMIATLVPALAVRPVPAVAAVISVAGVVAMTLF